MISHIQTDFTGCGDQKQLAINFLSIDWRIDRVVVDALDVSLSINMDFINVPLISSASHRSLQKNRRWRILDSDESS